MAALDASAADGLRLACSSCIVSIDRNADFLASFYLSLFTLFFRRFSDFFGQNSVWTWTLVAGFGGTRFKGNMAVELGSQEREDLQAMQEPATNTRGKLI